MSTAKYKVFNDGGLRALVNQTKANKIAAGDNSAAIEGLTTDLQEMSTQVSGVFGEVESCLNELDTVKADTASVNQALDGKLAKTGDGSNVTATFTQASSRANITSGEKLATIFGKIAKYFADLKAVAFSGSYNDLSNKPTIPTVTNDLTNALKANYDAAYTHSTKAHAPAGAQANVIESISVNGTAQTITSKNVDIEIESITNAEIDAILSA